VFVLVTFDSALGGIVVKEDILVLFCMSGEVLEVAVAELVGWEILEDFAIGLKSESFVDFTLDFGRFLM
jgi:hypothetical protein